MRKALAQEGTSPAAAAAATGELGCERSARERKDSTLIARGEARLCAAWDAEKGKASVFNEEKPSAAKRNSARPMINPGKNSATPIVPACPGQCDSVIDEPVLFEAQWGSPARWLSLSVFGNIQMG